MLQQETLLFLKELEENNNRDWFAANKARYQQSMDDFKKLVKELIDEIALFDPAVAGLEEKDVLFRIYRDVRFSKNKEPYKPNFGAFIARDGRKSPYAGYYFHVQANGKSMLAGGAYMPAGPILNAIRQEIDYNTKEFVGIINDKNFKKKFGALQGEQLKKSPKNYPADHPFIELLKYKSYLMVHPIKDELLSSKKLKPYILETFQAMKPLNDFINRTIA